MGTQTPVLPQPGSAQAAHRAQMPRSLPWPHLIPALATGALLYACYFPLAWGWLGWVALVPLLSLVRSDASKKRLFLCAWAGGLLFFWPVLQWMRVADLRMYATWALLATYCALYFPVAVLLVRALDRHTRLPLVVSVPVVWVGLEFLRSHLATGFGWYLLAHAQHDLLPVIQIADLGGAYAVSALVAAVNALLFEHLYIYRWFRLGVAAGSVAPLRPRGLVLQTAAILLLVCGTLAYGAWRLGQEHFAVGPRLALVQGSLDIRLKNEAWSSEPGAADAADAMRRHHTRLTDVAAHWQPDLIVWPETSWPAPWEERVSGDGWTTQSLTRTVSAWRRMRPSAGRPTSSWE
jgi:apolipoprotein N-acyltransferase